MRTVDWSDGTVKLIDQRSLPWCFEHLEIKTHQEMASAIKDMVVRGAPAIGVAGAYGLVLAAVNFPGSFIAFPEYMKTAAVYLTESRPTAVNLQWAVSKVLTTALAPENTSHDQAIAKALWQATYIAEQDILINKQMGEHGARLVQDGDTILHHCNTGSLATVEWGTALGVIRTAHYQGKTIHVLLDETRPRLQGALLSAWELEQEKIPYEIIADNAAGYFMKKGEIDIVFVGADRTTRQGDVANKIGTYQVAVLAHENGIPFFPVVPTSTIDLSLNHGDEITIEHRGPEEIRSIRGFPVIPENYPVRNPAFDVTPHRYITGIVTENGVAYPPYDLSLPAMKMLA